MVFLTLAVAQLAIALGVRARPGSWANPALLLAVFGAFALQLTAVYLAPLQDLLGTQPLTLHAALLVLLAAVPGYGLARWDRWRSDRRHARVWAATAHRPDSGDRRSAAGIVIPATAKMGRRLVWGEVVSTGTNVRLIQVGDQVLYDPEDRAEVEVRGTILVLMRERDIHAVAAGRLDQEGFTGLYL